MTKSPERECAHCGGDIAIRNPSGNCDHLFYPESCEVCLETDPEKRTIPCHQPSHQESDRKKWDKVINDPQTWKHDPNTPAPTPNTGIEEIVEDLRHQIYRFTDRSIINQRAVDKGNIDPPARDEMYMRAINQILDELTSTLTKFREQVRAERDGELLEMLPERRSIETTASTTLEKLDELPELARSNGFNICLNVVRALLTKNK